MRLNWIISEHDHIHGHGASMGHLRDACRAFYEKYKITPDIVKMTYQDYDMFLGQIFQQSVQTLESGKRYGLFVMVPGGMVELLLLDTHDESVGNNIQGQTVMVVENSQADREFEKHILNAKGKKKR